MAAPLDTLLNGGNAIVGMAVLLTNTNDTIKGTGIIGIDQAVIDQHNSCRCR